VLVIGSSQPRAPNKRYLTPKGMLLAWITRAHRALYAVSFGLVGHTVFQRAEEGAGIFLRPIRVLLLTTTGRFTGLPRTVPLPYFEYDGRRFVVGSFAGSDRHPAWFLNLRDKPEVHVQRGAKKGVALAFPLGGEDRARYWKLLADDWPRYRLYQAGTSREIPLVELVERAGGP
jgi:deazaflavin-dependent oxidoreductase (nitroreductase family)